MLYKDENAYYAYADARELCDDAISNNDFLTPWFEKNADKFLELDAKFTTEAETPEEIVKEYHAMCDDFEEVYWAFVEMANDVIHEFHLDKFADIIIKEYIENPKWLKIANNF